MAAMSMGARTLPLLCAACALAQAAWCAEDAEPVNPFTPPQQQVPKLNGYLVLSDDTKIKGHISVTPGLLVKVFDRAAKKHVELPLEEIARIDVEVEKEWLDREWRWKEAGSPEKVYTDQYYYNHKYVCTLTLTDGGETRGDLNVVLYLQNAAGKKKFFIRKYHKGKQGAKDHVPKIVYVRQVVFGNEHEEDEP